MKSSLEETKALVRKELRKRRIDFVK